MWGERFSPYVMLGVGYFDIDSSDSQQVEIESSVHANYGLGVQLFELENLSSDLSWSHLSGDIDVFELGFSYHFL